MKKTETQFISTHKLDFEICPWEVSKEFMRFRIGTCDGLWRSTKDSFDILAISNSSPGNGHLEDVFDWFYNSCRRDKRNLRILELWNDNFKQHLINKKGFTLIGLNAIKYWRKIK